VPEARRAINEIAVFMDGLADNQAAVLPKAASK